MNPQSLPYLGGVHNSEFIDIYFIALLEVWTIRYLYCPSVGLPVCLSVYLYGCLNTCACCLSVYLSVCLFLSLSIEVYRTPSSISFFPLRNNVGLLSFLDVFLFHCHYFLRCVSSLLCNPYHDHPIKIR